MDIQIPKSEPGTFAKYSVPAPPGWHIMQITGESSSSANPDYTGSPYIAVKLKWEGGEFTEKFWLPKPDDNPNSAEYKNKRLRELFDSVGITAENVSTKDLPGKSLAVFIQQKQSLVMNEENGLWDVLKDNKIWFTKQVSKKSSGWDKYAFIKELSEAEKAKVGTVADYERNNKWKEENDPEAVAAQQKAAINWETPMDEAPATIPPADNPFAQEPDDMPF